ncbi:MAG: hypothetical protein NC039_04820 [Muribaculaceae bacterium]|nr:hypothetical protein [Muribaculaceae bacterium]
MNKLQIFGMMALAVAGLTSCEPDDSPVIQEPTEFVLNTPPFASELYQLTNGNTIEFTCSQPNYGLTLAPAYSIEVSIHEDFGASLEPIDPQDEEAIPYSVVIVPDNPYSAVIEIKDQSVSNAILAMRGITEEGDYTESIQPLYVRAIASINNQDITTIVSNTITLPQVKDYMSLESSYPVLYVPGSANGWNQEASMQLLGYEKDAESGQWIKFRGLTFLNGEFKFTDKPNWDGTNFGFKAEGQLDTDGGAGNLPLPESGEGLYWVEVDIKALTYSATIVSSFGLAGDFNGWNAAAPAEFTEHTADCKKWTYTGELADGGYKFIINGPTNSNAWAINYGGPADEVTFDGPNLPATAGTHTVTLDLSVIPYTVTYQ